MLPNVQHTKRITISRFSATLEQLIQEMRISLTPVEIIWILAHAIRAIAVDAAVDEWAEQEWDELTQGVEKLIAKHRREI